MADNKKQELKGLVNNLPPEQQKKVIDGLTDQALSQDQSYADFNDMLSKVRKFNESLGN